MERFIYKTTNIVNNKEYIGQHTTNNIDDQYIGSGFLLQKAVRKYGKEKFKREILMECKSIQELNNFEIFFIDKYNTLSPNGYNLQPGGKNYEMTDEIKEKISKSRIGQFLGQTNPNWEGKSFNKKTKKQISKSVKQKYKDDPDYKIKISNTSKNRKKSQKSKNIMREKMLGNTHKRGSSISSLVINNIIKDYPSLSMNKLGVKYKISPPTIKQILLDNNISIVKKVNQFH